jgi:hypothetical protein
MHLDRMSHKQCCVLRRVITRRPHDAHLSSLVMLILIIQLGSCLVSLLHSYYFSPVTKKQSVGKYFMTIQMFCSLAGGVVQVAVCLPSKALSSNCSTHTKKKSLLWCLQNCDSPSLPTIHHNFHFKLNPFYTCLNPFLCFYNRIPETG